MENISVSNWIYIIKIKIILYLMIFVMYSRIKWYRYLSIRLKNQPNG